MEWCKTVAERLESCRRYEENNGNYTQPSVTMLIVSLKPLSRCLYWRQKLKVWKSALSGIWTSTFKASLWYQHAGRQLPKDRKMHLAWSSLIYCCVTSLLPLNIKPIRTQSSNYPLIIWRAAECMDLRPQIIETHEWIAKHFVTFSTWKNSPVLEAVSLLPHSRAPVVYLINNKAAESD